MALATDPVRRNQRDYVRTLTLEQINSGAEPNPTQDNDSWDQMVNWAAAIRDVHSVPVAAGWINARARMQSPTNTSGGRFDTVNAVPTMTRVLNVPVQRDGASSGTPGGGGTTGSGGTPGGGGGGTPGGGTTGGGGTPGAYTPEEQALIDRYTSGGGGGTAGGGTTSGGGGYFDASKAPGGGGGAELDVIGKFDLGTAAGEIVGSLTGALPDAATNPVVMQVLQWLVSQGMPVLRRLTDAIGLTSSREDGPMCRAMLDELQKKEPEVYAALVRAVCNAPPIGLSRQGEWTWYAIRMARNPQALEMIEGSQCQAVCGTRR